MTLRVLPNVLIFGLEAALISWWHLHWSFLALEVGPIEVVGGVLGLLLVLRTNAGYDRWWEARKAWGSLVNETRALWTAAQAYCQAPPAWQTTFHVWCALYPPVLLHNLRGLVPSDALLQQLTPEVRQALQQARHRPTFVLQQIAALLASAHRAGQLSDFALIGLEGSRVRLLGSAGICERILRTPLPRVYVLKIRRLLAVYLLALPLALVDKVGWATPFLTMLLAYAVLGMDRIAHELQNPFSREHLSHLPLDTLCENLQAELREQATLPLPVLKT